MWRTQHGEAVDQTTVEHLADDRGARRGRVVERQHGNLLAYPIIRALQAGDVDLDHLQHRRHHPLRPRVDIVADGKGQRLVTPKSADLADAPFLYIMGAVPEGGR